MRRQLTIVLFVLMVILGLCGAASAASDVSVKNQYLNNNGKTINTANVGDVIKYKVDVSNKGDATANNVVDVVGQNTQSTVDFDLLDEKVSKGQILDNGDWAIGSLAAGTTESLTQTLKVLSSGSEIFEEVVYEDNVPVASSIATLIVPKTTSPKTVQGKTVGMQATGAPFAPLALALLMVIGGLVYTKKQQ